jgi:hypothetical protein
MVVIGGMTKVCPNCTALKWEGETIGMCCSSGKVELPPLLTPPAPLKSFMTGETPQSKLFLTNIGKYNSCFQMTSFVANEIKDKGRFWPTFKIQGQIYHHAGSLLPMNDQPKFIQIYFMGDQEKQAQERQKHITGTQLEVILALQQMLHQHHVYIN